MTAQAQAAAIQADERITADRDELKFLVAPAKLNGLVSELNEALPRHRFTGEGANRLPAPHHYVTTIYFDTPSRKHFRAAASNALDNVKLRAKKYYDLHPSLVELATNPAQLVREGPWLWLELKRRDKTRTSKHRFRICRQEIPLFLGQRGDSVCSAPAWAPPQGEGEPGPSSIPPPMQDPERGDSRLEKGAREIAHYCRMLGEPLVADCVVNYRRLSWQNHDGSVRVTLDLGLAFYAPPRDLWTAGRDQALLRGELGVPRAIRPNAVLEVKSRGATPGWLQAAMTQACVWPEQFGKFVAASRAVHGDD